jgi:hypothetical protein
MRQHCAWVILHPVGPSVPYLQRLTRRRDPTPTSGFTLRQCQKSRIRHRPGPADPPDEFFEFTADDFHSVTAASGRATQRREAGLRTAKLRANELRARAAKFGPVRPLYVSRPSSKP